MHRRQFNQLCSGLLAGAVLSARQVKAATRLPASLLIESSGRALEFASIDTSDAYVFHYPYVTTPCFLIRLDEKARSTARSGIAMPAARARGQQRARDAGLFAFSAICSHKMTHPAVPISHISYRADTVSYQPSRGKTVKRSHVISCCSERSVYDALDGARVLSGPAPQPLAQILIELSNDGQIVAIGSTGPDQYERFLDTFSFRLAMEHGVQNVRAPTGPETLAVPAEQFSAQQVRC